MPRLTADGPRELAALILAASPGGQSRLPTERQLAQDFGVPRSAIRHAMAVLQAEGRISREVGRGTFLRKSVPDTVGTDPAGTDYSPADVMLVRRMFEPRAMPLVVAWATAPDFAEMDRCLHGGDQAADQAEFEVWDGALHRSIIAATHSPLLVRLYAEVERARQGKVWGDLKRQSASAARREEYRRDHAEIVAALRSRAADAAAEAMGVHLARVSRHLLGTELSADQGLPADQVPVGVLAEDGAGQLVQHVGELGVLFR
jgi:DNA-binding FadR family transcriptional regulator